MTIKEIKKLELRPDCQYIFVFKNSEMSSMDAMEFDRVVAKQLNRSDFVILRLDDPNNVRVLELPHETTNQPNGTGAAITAGTGSVTQVGTA